MLIEELRKTNIIRGKGSAWQLADELLKLFDELELSNHDAVSLVSFLEKTGSELFIDDANTVSRLWNARVKQMDAEGVTDRTQIYSHALDMPAPVHDIDHILLCGYDWLQAKELSWLGRNWSLAPFTVLANTASPLSEQLCSAGLVAKIPETEDFLDACFSHSPELLARAQNLSNTAPGPFLEHCRQHTAASPEHEARFIDAQIRQWLIEGKENIALVTEDRQLARRVSALLQHANLRIHDDAGWPLSTTVAAGALERWLECLENDFPQRALLDVLKSSFCHLAGTDKQDTYHFERDIVLHEKVARGLENYLRAIEDRSQRLQASDNEYGDRLKLLLQGVSDAADQIKSKLNSGPLRVSAWLNLLEQSLDRLGMTENYSRDAAGMRLLQEFDDMRQSEQGRDTLFSWQEFRQWLKRAMETHNFRPAREAGPVRIISLQQSLTGQYDAVILAGADSSRLPHPVSRLIFFNDQAKQQLGLVSASQIRERQLFQFRRLLEQSKDVVLSHSANADNSPQMPSPWISRINSFLKANGGSSLQPAPLGLTQDILRLQLQAGDDGVPNTTDTPAPSAPQDLLPKRWTATSHQQLVDCPYKYFASYILALRPPEEIIEQMSHREFGERAHRCLQAFHGKVRDLPGPFGSDITDENKAEALALLLELGERVFCPGDDPDVRHSNWFRMWRNTAPAYLDWQQQWQAQWKVVATEWQKEIALCNEISLFGKLDRLDQNQLGQQAILDYKSGSIQSRKGDMISGEDVQLSSYAALVSKPEAIAYLSLKANAENTKRSAILDGEELHDVSSAVHERLTRLASELLRGSQLPANGDEQACRYCAAEGLCRKEMWEGNISGS